MINAIFAQLPDSFVTGTLENETSYYFSIDDCKKTVLLGPEQCRVEEGKTVEAADCICKTGSELFLKIWNDGYRPGVSDFISGKIKSNDPLKLKTFLAAFGK